MFVQLECFHSGLAIRSPAVLAGERVHDAHREGFMITRASRNENSRSYVVPTGTGPSTPFAARLVSPPSLDVKVSPYQESETRRIEGRVTIKSNL
jgi:hypothetical protein